jgi:hypothetical protein
MITALVGVKKSRNRSLFEKKDQVSDSKMYEKFKYILI